jgi:hypothetical protein
MEAAAGVAAGGAAAVAGGRPTVGRDGGVRDIKGLEDGINGLVRIGLAADGCDREVVEIQRRFRLR